MDITPDYPVRLSGYGGRRLPNTGISQHIFAKALAIGSDDDGPAVLVTVDNCGIPASMRDPEGNWVPLSLRATSRP